MYFTWFSLWLEMFVCHILIVTLMQDYVILQFPSEYCVRGTDSFLLSAKLNLNHLTQLNLSS